jgi:N-hydroxyarylamine O-acetyltransferase
MEQIQVKNYLKRIKIDNIKQAGVEELRTIHKGHLLNIPFENLSIHCGEKIVLDSDKLYEKIIINKRGGFCYELNFLFYSLLSSLDYKSKMISAGVYDENGIAGPEFDHMAIITEVDGKEWLCDVGFGDSFIEPIEFTIDKHQTDRGRFFKISKSEDRYTLSMSDNSRTWRELYIFTTDEQELSRYQTMCLYHQTSPDSTFKQKRICTIATEYGRITLRDTRVIITRGKEKTETSFSGEDKFRDYLKLYFNIVLEN